MKYVFVLLTVLLSTAIASSQSYEDGMIFYRKGFNKDISEEERKVNLDKALNIFRKVSKNEEWTQDSYDSRTRIAAIHNTIGSNKRERREYKKRLYVLSRPPSMPLVLCGIGADERAISILREYVISYLGLGKITEASNQIFKEPSSFISANDNGRLYIGGTQIDVIPFVEVIHLVKDNEILRQELEDAVTSIKSNYNHHFDNTGNLYVETIFLETKIYIFPKDFDSRSNIVHFNNEKEVIEYYKQLFLESKFVKELQAYL